MSHIVTIKTEFKDLQALKNACRRLGWTFKEGQQTYQWWGVVQDDSYPAKLFTEEANEEMLNQDVETRKRILQGIFGKCTHAIGVPNAKYEIGLRQRGQEYIPLWDQFYPGGLDNITEENGMAGFVQAYAIEKCKLEALRQGHACTETVLQDGTVKLTVTEY